MLYAQNQKLLSNVLIILNGKKNFPVPFNFDVEQIGSSQENWNNLISVNFKK